MRESNPQLTITNGLLYHLTNPAAARQHASAPITIGWHNPDHQKRRALPHLIACSHKFPQQARCRHQWQSCLTTWPVLTPSQRAPFHFTRPNQAKPGQAAHHQNAPACKTVNPQAMA